MIRHWSSYSSLVMSWLALALATTSAFSADSVRHPHEAGLSGMLSLDYDGSRHRTSAFSAGAEVEWGSTDYWISLSFDTYSDLKSDWRMRNDSYATLQLGTALYRNNEDRLYVNATLDLDFHSQLATHGGDITPELNAAWGVTEDWWVAISMPCWQLHLTKGTAVATRP